MKPAPKKVSKKVKRGADSDEDDDGDSKQAEIVKKEDVDKKNEGNSEMLLMIEMLLEIRFQP